jgi:hypothetical protein
MRRDGRRDWMNLIGIQQTEGRSIKVMYSLYTGVLMLYVLFCIV